MSILITSGEDNGITVVAGGDSDIIIAPSTGGAPGAPGPAGPAGTDGADGADGTSGGFFRFVQGTPAVQWVIDHGLPYPPNITVVDSGGNQVEGDPVYVGNTVVVTFSAAFAGTAYLS